MNLNRYANGQLVATPESATCVLLGSRCSAASTFAAVTPYATYVHHLTVLFSVIYMTNPVSPPTSVRSCTHPLAHTPLSGVPSQNTGFQCYI